MNFKKKYQVLPLQTNSPTSVTIGDRTMHLGQQGVFRVSDPGVAREIEARHGKKGDQTFLVAEQPNCDREPGHNYTFTMPPKTWRSDPKKAKFKWIQTGTGKYAMIPVEE